MNSKDFSLKIEQVVKDKKISYMEAVIWYCDENKIDTATVGPLVNKTLKEKIQVEATDLRMLNSPPAGKLPL